jgi:hypothetical protein
MPLKKEKGKKTIMKSRRSKKMMFYSKELLGEVWGEK